MIVGAFLIRRNVIEGDDDGRRGDGPRAGVRAGVRTELREVRHARCAPAGWPRRHGRGRRRARRLDRGWPPATRRPAVADVRAVPGDGRIAAGRRRASPPASSRSRVATAATAVARRRSAPTTAALALYRRGRRRRVGMRLRTWSSRASATSRSATALASFASAVAGLLRRRRLQQAVWERSVSSSGWFSGWCERCRRGAVGGHPLATMLTRSSCGHRGYERRRDRRPGCTRRRSDVQLP